MTDQAQPNVIETHPAEAESFEQTTARMAELREGSKAAEERLWEKMGLNDDQESWSRGAKPLGDPVADEPEPAAQPQQREVPRQASPEREAPSPASDSNLGLWSEADVASRVKYETRANQLNAAIAQFNDIKARADRLPDGPEKQQWTARLAQWRHSLNGEAKSLDSAANELVGAAQNRRTEQLKRHIASEGQKLHAALPGTDLNLTRSYALSLGWSEQNIARLYDHTVIATIEKARRYDEMQRNPKPRAIRKVGERQPQQPKRSKARTADPYSQRQREVEDIIGAQFERLGGNAPWDKRWG